MPKDPIFDHQPYHRFCWAAEPSSEELEACAASALHQVQSAIRNGDEKAAVDAAMSLYEIASELEHRRESKSG